MAHVGQVFESTEALYADDERRRRSREGDYGVWWTEHRGGPRWRVSHLIDTDETYAACAGGWGGVSKDHVEILAVGLTYAEVDEAMGDKAFPEATWTEYCGKSDGLAWVRRQLREAMKAKAR